MIHSKFFKKVLMCALAITLTTTPMLAQAASTPGNSTPGTSTPGKPVAPSAKVEEETSATPASPAQVAKTNKVTLSDGTVINTTVPGHYFVTILSGFASRTPLAEINAAFALGAGERAVLKVYNSSCGPLAQDCVNNAAASLGATVGPMLDVFGGKEGNGGIQLIAEANSPITYTVGLNEGFKQAGYDYAVIIVQDGGKVTIVPDTDKDSNTVTFATKGFGVMAMVKAPAGTFNAYR